MDIGKIYPDIHKFELIILLLAKNYECKYFYSASD
jgi:hypothetical protein